MNSNGLRLAEDESLCQALANLGIYVVLSFLTLNADTSLRIHGQDLVAAKIIALNNLQRYGIQTTLLNVMIRGMNETEIGSIIQLAKENSVVRSVTVQTMTYTGMGGGNFNPRETMPLDGAAKAIEQATNEEIQASHFIPQAGAHPLCYSTAFFFKDKNRLRSFIDVFTPAELKDLMGCGYLLQPDDSAQEIFRNAIDRIWTAGDPEKLLPAIKRLMSLMYPPGRTLTRSQRQRIAEENILAIYLHSHMDEDTLDLARLVACPDQVPDSEGRLIPACAYNLFYRQKDPRFWCA